MELLQALKRDNTYRAKKLILEGVCLETTDSDGKTPLHIAAEMGNLEISQLLLQHEININELDNFGRVALEMAVFHGYTDIVKLFLDMRCDIYDECQAYELLNLALSKKHFSIIELILESNQSYNFPIPEGLLCKTAEAGCFKIVELLVKKYNVDIEDGYFREAPINQAIANGHIEIVKFLYNNGAFLENEDYRGSDYEGYYALHYAVQNKQYDIVKYLTDTGAYIEIQDSRYRTPLEIACENRDIEMIKILLTRGASCDFESANWEENKEFLIKVMSEIIQCYENE